MTQTAVPSPPQWIARAISGIAELPSRIATAIEDWRERDILQREFAELGARGELDRVLEDAGMSRCDISVLLKNGSVTRRTDHLVVRMAVILERGDLPLQRSQDGGDVAVLPAQQVDCLRHRRDPPHRSSLPPHSKA